MSHFCSFLHLLISSHGGESPLILPKNGEKTSRNVRKDSNEQKRQERAGMSETQVKPHRSVMRNVVNSHRLSRNERKRRRGKSGNPGKTSRVVRIVDNSVSFSFSVLNPSVSHIFGRIRRTLGVYRPLLHLYSPLFTDIPPHSQLKPHYNQA